MRRAVAAARRRWRSASRRVRSRSPPAAPPAATARLVTIDVIVTDARGRAVDDLKPADFELREDGAPLPIEAVRLVRVAADRRPSAPAAHSVRRRRAAGRGQDEARLFAIFLDEYHVSAGAETERVREALTRFVDRDVCAARSRRRHEAARFAARDPPDARSRRGAARDRRASRGARATTSRATPTSATTSPATPARIDAARTQVALSALNALAVHLGSLTDRRKTLIVVTEGVGRAERRRGQEYLPTLDTIIRSANRSNVSVYPFDPRDAADGEPAADGAAPPRRRDRRRGDRRPTLDAGPAPRRGRLERVLPADVPVAAPRRRQVPRAAGAREAAGRRRARAQGLLGAVAGRSAARGADREGERAEGGGAARAGAAREPADPAVVRRVARRRRQDARDVRLGAGARACPAIACGSTVSTLVLRGALAPDGTRAVRRPGRRRPAPAAVDEPGGDAGARRVRRRRPGGCGCGCRFRTRRRRCSTRTCARSSIRDLAGDVAIGTPEVLRARNAREFRALDAEAARAGRVARVQPDRAAADPVSGVRARRCARAGGVGDGC